MSSTTTSESIDPGPSRKSRHSRSRRRGFWPAVVAGLVAIVAASALYVWSRRAVNPDQLWMAAQEALKAQRIDEAQGLASQITRLRGANPMDWMLLAQLDMARDETDSAIEKLAKIPDDHRMAAQARLMSGQLELRRQRVRFAEHYLREAITLDPSLAQAHSELIYIYGYQLRRRELNAEFLALSRLRDLTFDNVFHWCLMRLATWEPGPIIKDLSRFVAADPEDRWSKLAIAENYQRQGLLDEAKAAIASLPESDLDALAIRVMLAIDRHEEEAERMLALGPEDYPPLARIRGRLALARRDASSAARSFRIALADDPLHRDTLLGLANALTLLGEEKELAPVRDTFRKLELLNSLVQRAAGAGGRNNPELVRALGEVCADLGLFEVATAWYKVAIAGNPLDPVAQQALYRLSERAGAASRETRNP